MEGTISITGGRREGGNQIRGQKKAILCHTGMEEMEDKPKLRVMATKKPQEERSTHTVW